MTTGGMEPTPYASGKAPAAPAVVRPPGRVGLFLAAMVVFALVGADLRWSSWLPQFRGGGRFPRWSDATYLLFVPGLLLPLWAYLSDRVSVLQTRREGYLLLAGLIAAATWSATVFVPHTWGAAIAIGIGLRASGNLAGPALGGAFVELGRRQSAAGRLAACYAGAQAAISLVDGVLVAPILRGGPIVLTAGVGAGLALVLVVALTMLTGDASEPGPEGAPAAPARIGAFLRSRTFWSIVAVTVLSKMAGAPLTALSGRPGGSLPTPQRVPFDVAGMAANVAAAVAYARMCRRMSAGRLLRLGMLGAAFGLLILRAVIGLGEGVAFEAGCVVSEVASWFAHVALLAIVLRAAPAGREAVGFVLLTSLPRAPAALLESLLGTTVSPATAADVGLVATLLAVLAVFLVPQPLLAGRDAPRTPRAA